MQVPVAKRPGSSGQGGGFTLIELLVVISIISLLMSIMMPSLNRARAQANSLDCMNNLRQLTMAWIMYSMENDDMLCDPDTDFQSWGRTDHWVADGPIMFDEGNTREAIYDGVLWPYLENLDVYKCVSDKSAKLRSYSMSWAMGGPAHAGLWYAGCPENSGHYAERNFQNYLNITRGANRLVFIDAQSFEKWLDGPFQGHRGYDVPVRFPWATTITGRHLDGCNLSFADGHVGHRRWQDPRTINWCQGIRPADECAVQNNVDAEWLFQISEPRSVHRFYDP